MSAVDPWAPLGGAGRATVADTLTTVEINTIPARTPWIHRCDVDIAGHRVNFGWRQGRVLVASLRGEDGDRGPELATGSNILGDGQDSIVWGHTLKPVEVLGEPVEVERRRSGRDRWCWQVHGPGGRAWTFRPGGLVFADRMELARDGERTPAVVHELRPVPGTPRAAKEPPTVSWDDAASLAEVVLPVMWVLDRAYEGLLPKPQRIARADFLFG